MKKQELKKLAKSARKLIREDIKLSLVNSLKEVIGKIEGQNVDDLEKQINKGAKQLAKKLSKRTVAAKLMAEQPVITIEPAPEAVKPVSLRKKKAAVTA
ncbi:hypothetical protein [Mucilaginibacter sp.]